MASHDSDCPYLDTEDAEDCICGALEDPDILEDDPQPEEDEAEDEED